MADDPEIRAMAALKSALEPLEEETREHVIRWAADRFGVALPKGRAAGSRAAAGGTEEYEDIGALFSAANPTTEADKALVGGYWLQVVKGQESFDGQSVNSELKNLGHGLSNITRAFDSLKSQHPQLARQVSKSGRTRQARKLYKITEAGSKRVTDLVAGNGGAS